MWWAMTTTMNKMNKINNLKVSLYYYNIMENKTDLERLKNKLEKEGEEKLKKLYDSNKGLSKVQIATKKIDDVVNIMKEGEKEFIEKTGRHLTWSEIREIYG